MRWGEHWRISRDCLEPRKSLVYQLGSILPDWFNRHPIHRWSDTKELFLERAYKVKMMKKGLIRDWNLGILSHFICDYCCMAHNELYYELYKHRVYEVRSQKLYKDLRLKRNGNKEKWLNYDVKYDLSEVENCVEEKDFKNNVEMMVEYYLEIQHGKIGKIANDEWYKDSKNMKLDITFAYLLLRKLLFILN